MVNESRKQIKRMDTFVETMRKISSLASRKLVQHCRNNSEYSTRYFRHHRVVVSQRCTRHRLLPPPCADKNSVHCIHCYFCNAVLEYILPFYSPRGRPAKNQAQALRSLILFVLLFNKTPAKASLTAWVRYVLVGCTCTEELPPLGSYYDFMNRFWLALRNGYSRHSLFPKGRNSKKPDKRLTCHADNLYPACRTPFCTPRPSRCGKPYFVRCRITNSTG